MKLYQHKNLNVGFIILAPDRNLSRIKSTVRSLSNHYPSNSKICILPENISENELQEIAKVCKVSKAGTTITSMINVGLRVGCKEWNIFVMEGAIVYSKIDIKYSFYVESEKDVLFPLLATRDREGKMMAICGTFDTATLNGLMIHQKTFLDVGDFTDSTINASKFMWGAAAQDKGMQFKAVLGVKI